MTNFQFTRHFILPLKQIKISGQKTNNFLEFYDGRMWVWSRGRIDGSKFLRYPGWMDVIG